MRAVPGSHTVPWHREQWCRPVPILPPLGPPSPLRVPALSHLSVHLQGAGPRPHCVGGPVSLRSAASAGCGLELSGTPGGGAVDVTSTGTRSCCDYDPSPAAPQPERHWLLGGPLPLHLMWPLLSCPGRLTVPGPFPQTQVDWPWGERRTEPKCPAAPTPRHHLAGWWESPSQLP